MTERNPDSLLDMLLQGISEIERATGNKVTAIWAGPKAYRRLVLETSGQTVFQNITVELMGSTEKRQRGGTDETMSASVP